MSVINSSWLVRLKFYRKIKLEKLEMYQLTGEDWPGLWLCLKMLAHFGTEIILQYHYQRDYASVTLCYVDA